MRLHELADLFPQMSEGEYNALRDDISKRGQIEPILLYKGRIVDGRHRLRACRELGIEPKTTEWQDDEDSLVQHAIALNIHRRHLTTSQRAMVASKLATLKRGQHAVAEISASQDEVSKIFAVSPDSIQFARKILDSGKRKVIDEVFSGQKTVSKAYREIKAEDSHKKRIIKRTSPTPVKPRVGEGTDNLFTGSVSCNDCIKALIDLPDNSVNLYLTDPPYNADVARWDKNFDPTEFIRQVERTLAPTGSAIIFCHHKLLPWYMPDPTKNDIGEQNVRLNFRQIIHWRKTNPQPMNFNAHLYYTPSQEYALWFTKSNDFVFNKNLINTALCGTNKSDTYNTTACSGRERYKKANSKKTQHPCQKPFELIESLLIAHSNVGDLVVDAFAGTGTTLAACAKWGRSFHGIELDPHFSALSAKRVRTVLGYGQDPLDSAEFEDAEFDYTILNEQTGQFENPDEVLPEPFLLWSDNIRAIMVEPHKVYVDPPGIEEWCYQFVGYNRGEKIITFERKNDETPENFEKRIISEMEILC